MRGLIVGVLFAAGVAHAGEPKFPETPAEFYVAGEAFAKCVGYLEFSADLAELGGLKDTQVLFQDTARGWRVAGLMLLVEGMELARQAEAQSVFDTLAANSRRRLRSLRETNPEGYIDGAREEYERICVPLTPMQTALIAAMRGAATD